MGRSKNKSKSKVPPTPSTNVVESTHQLQQPSQGSIQEPSGRLRKIYDGRNKFTTENVLSSLAEVATTLGQAGWMHPMDVEVFWLILGAVCDSENVQDKDLIEVCRLMECNKLYQQVGYCCAYILDLDVEASGKKLKTEYLLRAVCHVTFQILTVVEDVSSLIRPNYFMDLYSTVSNENFQQLGLDKKILSMLETTHQMFGGICESSDDSGVATRHDSESATPFEETEWTSLQPPDAIADWNIVPNREDVTHVGKVFLRPNKIRSPYPDLENYCDVQFRLMMEDFMFPLRQAILAKLYPEENKANSPHSALRVYERVTFWRGGLVNNARLIPERHTSWRYYHVKFRKLPKVNWEISRRLIHGSLVFLWDGADELISATVAGINNSNDLANGKVTLALEVRPGIDLPLNFLEKVYTMFESVAFFEPYRAILQVLQDFSYETFPMLDYFLGWEKNPSPPGYLKESTEFILTKGEEMFTVRNPLELFTWPTAQFLGLDEKQHRALIKALTSKVSVIQGPPGTGKTYLALKILGALLGNKALWKGKADNELLLYQLRRGCGMDSGIPWRYKNNRFWKYQGSQWRDHRVPIVIICLTNHALDQFLEQALALTDLIVRIGGQSKCEALNKYNLRELKNRTMNAVKIGSYSQSKYFYFFHQMVEVRKLMEIQTRSIQMKIRKIYTETLKVSELKKRGVISPEMLRAFEEEEQNQFKRKGRKMNILKWWLGWDNHRQLLKVLRELRLSVHSQAAREASDPVPNQETEEDYLPNSDRPGRGVDLEDVIIDDVIDEEDLKDEESGPAFGALPSDVLEEQPSGANKEADEHEDEEITREVLACPDNIDKEEKDIIDFANNQLERMQLIRDQLLSMPDQDIDVSPEDILSIPHGQRWLVFAQWKREYELRAFEDLRETEKKYEDNIKKYNELKGQALAALCRTADVVGMTTTGAAKNRQLLEALGARIVIVEEAAEVLESHIVCSLTSKCDQLIMIGDHQQLRPSVNAHHLAQDYQLDVSLFERLICGGMQPMRLGVQHRMRAEVARLISPSIYAHLENHSSVYDHPHVPGVGRDVFFYHHTHLEKEDGTSYFNPHEASMALGLALYLCQDQGLPAHTITILATYASQMHLISNIRKQLKWQPLRNTRIAVVDNFQGEENDVIILSLVRNNKRNSVGFLKIDNRVCVALSRARNGLYILGNMELLSTNSPLWAQIDETLFKNGEIGQEFPLRCDNHHQVIVKVKSVEDFPIGKFCREECGALLENCGHLCKKRCHSSGPHTSQCYEKVPRMFQCGHIHEMLCHQSVKGEVCSVLVTVEGSCGHSRKLPCGLRPSVGQDLSSAFPCTVLVPKTLPCTHIQMMPCHQAPDPFACKVEILARAECSHVVKVTCGVSEEKSGKKELHKMCKESVKKTLLCGHVKHTACNSDISTIQCGSPVQQELPCGHFFEFNCPGKSYSTVIVPCEVVVDHTMPNCGHILKGPCHKPPLRCTHEVYRTASCGHLVETQCFVKQVTCREIVYKQLKCGHSQPVACTEGTSSIVCHEMVEIQHPECSHMLDLPCFVTKDDYTVRTFKCEARVLKTLPCGHEQRLPCAEEADESVPCTTMVHRTLPCGHEVIARCGPDVASAGQGKCKIDCLIPMDCGHFCSLACHDASVPHICKLTVSKQLGCGHFQDMPCFRPESKAICFRLVSLERSCGHKWETTCGKISSMEENDCHALVEKRLPCGHHQRIGCSTPVESITCTARYDQVLGCRHTVSTLCGESLEKRLKIPCVIDIVKSLPCGHDVKVRCGSKDADKPVENIFCRILVEKKIPQCDHTLLAECGKKLTKSDCTHQKCDKKLACGHRCPLPCRQPCDTKLCEETVDLDGVLLPCKHLLRGPCNLRYADAAVIEAKKSEQSQCRSNCKEKLGCGHKCTAVCRECSNSQFHSICSQRCRNTLVCGHKCEIGCKDTCAPCKKVCEYRCQHAKCTRLCSEECFTCKEPCPRSCPHVKCDHPCNEYCVLEPCNKHCPKTLRCGHPCIGLCGEVCPPKCPPCAQVKIPNFRRNNRYIYLPDCEHWIEVESMDDWIKKKTDDDVLVSAVKAPSCPTCGQLIRVYNRYSNEIKSFYEDLISVKFDYVKDDLRRGQLDKVRHELIKLKPLMKDYRLEEAVESILNETMGGKKLTRDENWDQVNRCVLAYRFCCLLLDVKRTYPYSHQKNVKKTTKSLTLDVSPTGSILKKGIIALKSVTKRPIFSLAPKMFEEWRRLDYLRQLFVVEAIVDTLPVSHRVDVKPLLDAAHLFLDDRRLSEEDENFLAEVLHVYASCFRTNLSSSARKDIPFDQRLDMNCDTWAKCIKPNCESIYPRTRFNHCPDCRPGRKD